MADILRQTYRADYQAWRHQRDFTARKYAAWDCGERMSEYLSIIISEPRAESSRYYSVLRQWNQREEKMTRSGLTGVAAAILSSVLVGPAMAGHVISYPAHPAQSIFCATREAGNPHSKYCDYMGWSQWRRRGGWDSTLDNACLRNPGYVPGECSFNARGEPLFSTPL